MFMIVINTLENKAKGNIQHPQTHYGCGWETPLEGWNLQNQYNTELMTWSY